VRETGRENDIERGRRKGGREREGEGKGGRGREGESGREGEREKEGKRGRERKREERESKMTVRFLYYTAGRLIILNTKAWKKGSYPQKC
jgi:hypothetical protein